MNVAQETLDFRCATFSVALSLLMPTSAFLFAPVHIAVRLRPLRDLHALQSLNRMLPYHVYYYTFIASVQGLVPGIIDAESLD
jgi:hypothetical protein